MRSTKEEDREALAELIICTAKYAAWAFSQADQERAAGREPDWPALLDQVEASGKMRWQEIKEGD